MMLQKFLSVQKKLTLFHIFFVSTLILLSNLNLHGCELLDKTEKEIVAKIMLAQSGLVRSFQGYAKDPRVVENQELAHFAQELDPDKISLLCCLGEPRGDDIGYAIILNIKSSDKKHLFGRFDARLFNLTLFEPQSKFVDLLNEAESKNKELAHSLSKNIAEQQKQLAQLLAYMKSK